MKAAVKKTMLPQSKSSDSDNEGEMVAQLKEQFHITTKRSVKVQVLTVLPNSWSIKK